MAMAEHENEIGAGRQSPWKTPADNTADCSIMTAEAWPALSNGQPNNPEKPAEVVNSGANFANAQVIQASAGRQKFSNSSYKHGQSRHHKAGFKRSSNGVSSFPVHVPYYPPALPPVFPSMVSSSVPHAGYVYQPFPPPFPSADQMPKAFSETPMPAFAPPGLGIDANRNIQQSPKGNPNLKGANFSNRRRNAPEAGAPLYPAWRYQRPLGPRDSMVKQPVSRASVRPSFFGPSPAFLGGPSFPGPAPLYYGPAAAAAFSIRGPLPPRFVPHPMNPVVLMLPPETVALMGNIVKQIDYYFSDENLQTDHYLISQMDAEGWVPISTIADFKRVKRMSTDIIFIRDTLRSSRIVEVQGNRIRKRENWSKYVVASVKHRPPQQAQVTKDQATSVEVIDSRNDRINAQEGTSETATICSRNSDNLAEQSTNRDVPRVEKAAYGSYSPTSADRLASSCHRSSSNSSSKPVDLDLVNDFPTQGASELTEPPGTAAYEKDVIRGPSEVANFDDLSTDFSSTFMLDEELEMEQKRAKYAGYNSFRRIGDEDDELEINDQYVERLVIVTQAWLCNYVFLLEEVWTLFLITLVRNKSWSSSRKLLLGIV